MTEYFPNELPISTNLLMLIAELVFCYVFEFGFPPNDNFFPLHPSVSKVMKIIIGVDLTPLSSPVLHMNNLLRSLIRNLQIKSTSIYVAMVSKGASQHQHC